MTVWTLTLVNGTEIDLSGRGYLGGWQGDNNTVNGLTLDNLVGAGLDVAGSYGRLWRRRQWRCALRRSFRSPLSLVPVVAAVVPHPLMKAVMAAVGCRLWPIILLLTAPSGPNGTLGHGGASWAGCGSGGAINIDTITLSGSGTIEANGGALENSGGGGRIAVLYADLSTYSTNLITALGGGVQNRGGDGTVVLIGPGDVYGTLIIDGHNTAGPDTASAIPGGNYDNVIFA